MKTQIVICRVVLLLSLGIIFLNTTLYAQADEIQFERISIESGLSQSSVLCICQDSKDFLWFGTYSGLNRYDGYTFKVYKNDPENPFSLSKDNVEAILEDHLGTLWIGTEGGLDRFDRETEKFIHYKNNPNDTGTLSNNYVRSIYEDRSGILWIGTQGGGLNQFDRKKEKFIRYKNDPSNPKSLSQNNVLSILEDRHEHLWVGTDGGLNCFDRTKGEFTRYQNDPHDLRSISHNSIWRIYEDRSGNLWLATWGGGLNRFDPEENRFIRYQYNPNDPNSLSQNVVRSVHEDHSGNLWIGTDGGGLNRFVAGSHVGDIGRFIHYQNNIQDPTSLSGNSVLSIFEDKLGILWIGTNFDGIDKYNQIKRQFKLYRNHPNDVNSLSKNTIHVVCEDSLGMIWIGTNGGGLDRFDRKNSRFTHFVHNLLDPNSLSNNKVRSVCEDRQKRLWIGTEDGLNYFDRQKGKFIHYRNDPDNPHSISHNVVWSIYEDRAGNLWVGTFGGGLNRFDYATGKFTRYVHDQNNPKSISDDFIWTIYEDSSGVFWIGTMSGGLDRFDPEKGIFFHNRTDSRDSKSISDNKVMCLHEDYAGVLWLGVSNGLNKFDRNAGTFHCYSEKDGLANNSVQGILEDEHGNLWISTNHGLSKLDSHSMKFKNYFESYGLQSNEFGPNSCCLLKSGEMIFGGMNGFNIFHPDSIIGDSTLPRVVITDFQIFNKPVALGENAEGRTILATTISDCNEINLSYKDNVFTLEFAGLHYASPKDNLYAYKMDGFEKDWNYTDANRRFVTYTNLPGGTYTFHVKASNNQGIWNEQGTSIRIIITPPFWKTWWFYGLVFIVLGGVIYWIYMWRVQLRDLAAQRRLEAAIRKERNLLRTVIDNMPDGIYTKDLSYRKTLTNRADVYNMGRKSEAEVLGKDDYELYPKEMAEGFIADDRSVIQTGKPVIDREEYVIDGEDQKHYLLTTKLPLRDEQNLIIGLIGIGRDITLRKKAEDALQQERRTLRTLIDNIPDAIYIKDEKCRKVIANIADVHNMHLHSEAEVLGKDDFDLFPKELAESFIADDRKVIQTGQPVINREEYVIDEQGQKRWLLTTKLPLRDENNQIIGLVGIGKDITIRKQFEEYLQNEHNLLRTLIDNLPDYISIKDTEGRFVVVNMAVARQIGFNSPNELLGKTDFDLFPRELADRYFADEQKIIQSGRGLYEYEGPTIDKSKEDKDRWVTTIKVPLCDTQGKIISTVSISRDITERKRAEEERERLIKELQDAVADIKVLSGLVPICSSCKKIRDDKGYWTQLEGYIQAHSQAKFSHGVCPDCMKKLYPNFVPKKIE